MRITKRQLRRIIRETIDVMNAETGEIMSFADTEEYGIPSAPDKALPNIMKRLGLTNPDGTYKTAASSPGYQADMDIQTIDLNTEDWQDVYDEVEGKRYYRKNKAERARLDLDSLMTRLEDWASNAGAEYAADNPGVDGQDIARDLAQGAEYSFEKDEWEALLYTGPFDSPDDLYTYIADVIAQGSTLNERRMETDVFRIVTRALNQGPLTHQQLLANVLDAYPNTSDEDIDYHIDRLEDSGDIIFNPSMQKYQ